VRPPSDSRHPSCREYHDDFWLRRQFGCVLPLELSDAHELAELFDLLLISCRSWTLFSVSWSNITMASSDSRIGFTTFFPLGFLFVYVPSWLLHSVLSLNITDPQSLHTQSPRLAQSFAKWAR